jgi:transaldolase
MPEATLLAFGDHGVVDGTVPADGGDAEERLARFEAAGIGVAKLGDRLRVEGAEAFDAAWAELLDCIERKSNALLAVR